MALMGSSFGKNASSGCYWLISSVLAPIVSQGLLIRGLTLMGENGYPIRDDYIKIRGGVSTNLKFITSGYRIAVFDVVRREGISFFPLTMFEHTCLGQQVFCFSRYALTLAKFSSFDDHATEEREKGNPKLSKF